MTTPTHAVDMDTALADIEAMARELRRQIIPVDLWGSPPHSYDRNLDRVRCALHDLRTVHRLTNPEENQ